MALYRKSLPTSCLGSHSSPFQCCVLSHFSHVQLFANLACQAPLSTGFSSKNTGVGCCALLQEIFPTQGSNLGLLHCRRILYCCATGKASILGSRSLLPFVWGCGLLLSCRGNFLLFLLWRRVSKSHVTVWVLVQSNLILWTSIDICDSPVAHHFGERILHHLKESSYIFKHALQVPFSSSRSPNSGPYLESLTIHDLTLESHWGILKAHRDFCSHRTEMRLGFAFPVFLSCGLPRSSGFHFSWLTMPSPLFLCRPVWYLHTHRGSLLETHFLLVIQGWTEWASTGLKTECSQ